VEDLWRSLCGCQWEDPSYFRLNVFSFKKTLDEALNLEKHLGWHSYEYKKVQGIQGAWLTISQSSILILIYMVSIWTNILSILFCSNYVPMWCDSYQSSNHDNSNCPYHMLDAYCVSLEMMMNDD